jgi:hypothetical protein
MPPFEPGKNIREGYKAYQYMLSDAIRAGKVAAFGHLPGSIPSVQPLILQFGTQAAPVGIPTLGSAAADGINNIVLPGCLGMNYLQLHQTTAQTLLPLLHATKGIELAGDQVDNETVEYVPGGNNANNPLSYLAGTDPGVVFRATFEITKNNGSDQFGIGWRKQENYVTPTSFLTGGASGYTDGVLFGYAATVTNPNVIRSSTWIGSAVCVVGSTGFTVTDGTIITLEVRIKGRLVSYYINGVSCDGSKVAKDGVGTAITPQTLATLPTYTFTAGLRLIPYIFIRQDAATTTVFLKRFFVGPLFEDGIDPAQIGPQ